MKLFSIKRAKEIIPFFLTIIILSFSLTSCSTAIPPNNTDTNLSDSSKNTYNDTAFNIQKDSPKFVLKDKDDDDYDSDFQSDEYIENRSHHQKDFSKHRCNHDSEKSCKHDSKNSCNHCSEATCKHDTENSCKHCSKNSCKHGVESFCSNNKNGKETECTPGKGPRIIIDHFPPMPNGDCPTNPQLGCPPPTCFPNPCPTITSATAVQYKGKITIENDNYKFTTETLERLATKYDAKIVNSIRKTDKNSHFVGSEITIKIAYKQFNSFIENLKLELLNDIISEKISKETFNEIELLSKQKQQQVLENELRSISNTLNRNPKEIRTLDLKNRTEELDEILSEINLDLEAMKYSTIEINWMKLSPKKHCITESEDND